MHVGTGKVKRSVLQASHSMSARLPRAEGQSSSVSGCQRTTCWFLFVTLMARLMLLQTKGLAIAERLRQVLLLQCGGLACQLAQFNKTQRLPWSTAAARRPRQSLWASFAGCLCPWLSFPRRVVDSPYWSLSRSRLQHACRSITYDMAGCIIVTYPPPTLLRVSTASSQHVRSSWTITRIIRWRSDLRCG